MHKLAVMGLLGAAVLSAHAQSRNPFVPAAPKPPVVAPQPEMPPREAAPPGPPGGVLPNPGPHMPPLPGPSGIPAPSPNINLTPPLETPAQLEPPKEIQVKKSGKRLGVVNGHEIYRTDDGYLFRAAEELPVLKFVPELPSPTSANGNVPGPVLPPAAESWRAVGPGQPAAVNTGDSAPPTLMPNPNRPAQ
jgi:hypothetical protein